MEQRTSSLEEIILHHAMEQSHLHYGGQGPAKNPLELMIDRELDEVDAQRNAEAAEILLRLLTFAADGIQIDGVTATWKRIQRKIPTGHVARYILADDAAGIAFPSVEIRDAKGELVERYEPARLKSVYKPRKGAVSPSAEIKILTITPQSAAIRVGTRLISLAALAGVVSIREMSGAGVAKRLLVTRQAVSLTNKAMEAKIKEATGGKSGARGLRHKADPRKGKTLSEIKGE